MKYRHILLDNQLYIWSKSADKTTLSQKYPEIYLFFKEIQNDETTLSLHSSGTTGTPKEIILPKTAFQISAQNSLLFFKLKPKSTIGLCLPLQYIAGKMMIFRALEGNLNILNLPQKMNPLRDLQEEIDFIAMTPAQFSTVLSENPEKIKYLKTILLGGSGIDESLREKINTIAMLTKEQKIFLSYGMTETLSHIAIQDLQKNNDLYYTLPNIQITQDKRNCLVIQTNFLPEKIVTNDVVEMVNSSSFKYLGRLDNVINSGAIKIFPELLEEKIRPIFGDRRYVFLGISSPVFGEKLVLVIEGKNDIFDLELKLKIYLFGHLYPKSIFFVANFPTTVTGKIQRKLLVSMLEKTITKC